jgi:hypothetical protein
MLELKDGAVVCGNKYTNAIMLAAQMVFTRHAWPVVVTAGRDGVHGEHSYHAQDRALDLRVAMIPEAIRELVATELSQALPAFYDVVYEPEVVKDGAIVKGAHIHIEADAHKEGRV